jgi:hypothetical protein
MLIIKFKIRRELFFEIRGQETGSQKQDPRKPSMVAYAFNPISWEGEERRSQVSGQSGLLS